MITVVTKNYNNIEPDNREILRYAGCMEPDNNVNALMQSSLVEAAAVLSGKACYVVLSQEELEDIPEFNQAIKGSQDLQYLLRGCSKIVVMAATIGVGIDRLMAKYGKIAPSKALMFHAIGAETIEKLCDMVCQEISQELGVELTYRFSPGYGDLPLETQKTVFDILNPPKHIGLTLQESTLMAPSKSVTAIMGVKN